MTEPESPPPLLVPPPESVVLKGGGTRIDTGLRSAVQRLLSRRNLKSAGEEPHPGLALFRDMPAAGPEAYLLTIEPSDRRTQGLAITISGAGDAGLRHGLRTLKQLIHQYGRRLPCLEIEDKPAFKTRGVMLDVSRNKVPTMGQLELAVDQLAALKFNHLQLYTEHTFAYAGHEEVWADASPLTPDEVRALDTYCSARGVELAANQNCFGHLATWLKRPRYQHLAEIEGDGLWKFMHWDRRGPFSLCPVLPESEAFVRDLLGQLLPCFKSRLVNIGCDETFDVGWGRSKAHVQQASSSLPEAPGVAAASLYFDFVNKVCAIVNQHGKRPLLWADIAMTHPDMLARLPKDVIGLAWGYEPDAKFAEECSRLNDHKLEAWVCPGTSTWRSITGRTAESRANLRAAAACASAANVTGFLICDWGDVGHMQQWPLTMHRLADAAAAAWSGTRAQFDESHSAASSLHVFDDPALAIGPWLDRLGDLDLSLRTRCKVRNATAIFNDLFPPVPPEPGRRSLTDAPLSDWEAIRSTLRDLAASRPLVDDQLINDELWHTLQMADLAVEHGRSCRMSPDGLTPRPEDLAMLRDLAEGCLATLRRLWTIRNRSGGLEQAATHLQRVIDSLV